MRLEVRKHLKRASQHDVERVRVEGHGAYPAGEHDPALASPSTSPRSIPLSLFVQSSSRPVAGLGVAVTRKRQRACPYRRG
jgi:hypothetical protein